jgi:hypothetical protein
MYQLKITIDGIVPAIYRTIQVPESFSLNKLHHIIQIAFGWENSHIYCFMHADIPTTDPILWGGGTTMWDKKVKIKDVLFHVGDALPYEYDLGDSWKHTIVLEKIEPSLSKTVKCIDGERSAPPEDCGGVYGYQNMIHHLCHPEIDGYFELLEWLGDDFDLEHFDLELVNKNLRKLASYIREFEEDNGLR